MIEADVELVGGTIAASNAHRTLIDLPDGDVVVVVGPLLWDGGPRSYDIADVGDWLVRRCADTSVVGQALLDAGFSMVTAPEGVWFYSPEPSSGMMSAFVADARDLYRLPCTMVVLDDDEQAVGEVVIEEGDDPASRLAPLMREH